MALNPGDTLNNHYRIVRQLVRGGFGFVYLAQYAVLAEKLRRHGYDVTELVFNVKQTASRDMIHTRCQNLALEHDAVIFGEWQLIGRYTNWSDQWQEQLISALHRTGTPVVMVV